MIRILRFSAALLLAGSLLHGHGPGLVPRLGAETTAASYYVSPSGRPNGNGSIGNPWDLQTALHQPAAVHAGDTIWLRGGTYTGAVGADYSFACSLKGTAGLPISVRQYPGERAKIDGRGAVYGTILVQYSSWTVFRNLEVTDSDVSRNPPTAGLWMRDSNNIKFINMVVHDLPGQGFGFWQENSDSEIYGSLIYYNGSNKFHHGIYVDNENGTKRIADNILFTNAGFGVHGYASSTSAYENNIRIEGNVSFDNGLLVPGLPPEGNILLGVDSASSPAANPAILNNYSYNRASAMSAGQWFGYVNGCTNPVISGNYFVGDTYWANCTANATITGNTFYGTQFSSSSPSPSSFSNNLFTTSRPTGVKTVVRANQYDSGRANIAVYNWGLAGSVNVDLSGVVAGGATYEIRDAQNFFGPPVRSGVYGGGAVSIPMNGASVSPVAFPVPLPTGPEFKAFVVLSGQGSLPSPTATAVPPTATPTATAGPPTTTPTATAGPPTTTPTPAPVSPTPTAVPPTPTSVPPSPTPNPFSTFTFTPSAPAVRQSVEFEGSSKRPATFWAWDFGDGTTSSQASPKHAYSVAGQYRVTLMVGSATGTTETAQTIAVRVSPPCAGDATHLCLNGSRFEASVEWNVPSQGTHGVGTAGRLTPDTGYYWFFSPNNVELVVKVVDGRAVNGSFWVFFGGLTDVEFTLRVRDSETGRVQTYSNPQGILASHADTAAFLESSASAHVAPSRAAPAEGVLPNAPGAIESARSRDAEASLCVPSPTALCLNGGRFRVEVSWSVPAQGAGGPGAAIPLTSDTGYFWFFTANNVELVVKVVDGRAIDQKFWVFHGALSDVDYTITVTDTATGAIRTYVNRAGTLWSGADTAAF